MTSTLTAFRGRFRSWAPPPTSALMGVWFAVLLHGLWASLLLFSDDPKNVTAIAALAELFPAKTGLAIVLIAVASCASYGILRDSGPVGSRVMLLLPQQLVLGVSAAGALRAMWIGQFADGIDRPVTFLIADQSPAVLALLIHSATIVYLALTHRWK
jgi:hypothetical protein